MTAQHTMHVSAVDQPQTISGTLAPGQSGQLTVTAYTTADMLTA